MWNSIAWILLSALAQDSSKLEFLNVRNPLGLYGSNRPDANKYHTGDNYILSFDIQGLKISAEGNAVYSLAGELLDKNNKVVLQTPAKETETFNPLGGNRLPAYAAVPLKLDMPAGTYTYKLTLTDLADKHTATLSRTFEVVPKSLGFVLWHMTYEDNFPAPPVGVPGQVFVLRFCVTGFEVDQKTRKPNLSFNVRILDENGKPTLPKPFEGEAKEISEDFKDILPITFPIRPNRPGSYRIEVSVVDNMTRNRATIKQQVPFMVLEPK